MNLIRQLSQVSEDSDPTPSRTNTDVGSNWTNDDKSMNDDHSTNDDRSTNEDHNTNDDHSTNDDVLAPYRFLKEIFTDEVYEYICVTKRSSGNPLANSAERYIKKQSQNLGDYDSPEDLLRHYGIRIQKKSRIRGVFKLIRGIVPFKTNTAANIAAVDPVQTMKVLATIFVQENPDGGLGYSFGTLLQRYITRHLVLEYSFMKDIQYNLVGGEELFPIQNCQHDECIWRVKCVQGQEDVDVDVKLHRVSGKYIASSGTGHLLDRIELDLGDLLQKEDDIVYLFHGTSVDSASSIVLERPNVYAGNSSADFGHGFYLTESFQYALLAAHQAKAASSKPMECAVLVFPVQKSILENCNFMDLRNDLDLWAKVTKKGIQKLSFNNITLAEEYENAQCIVGPTVKNFDRVHSAREEPRPSEYIQWAFPKSTFCRDILDSVIGSGNLHFFRFYHEHEHEWESTTGERKTG